MQKPVYLLPFIFVYRIVFAIVKIPFNLIKYFCYGGLYITQLFVNGVIYISYLIYCFWKYAIYGFFVCFKLIIPVKSKKQKKLPKKKEKLEEIKEEPIVEEPITKEESIIDDESLDKENQPEIVENKIPDTIEEKNNEPIIVEKENILPNDLDEEIQRKINSIDYNNIKISEKELAKLTKEKLQIQKKLKIDKEKQQKEEIREEKQRARLEKKKQREERKKNLEKKSNDSYINEKVAPKKPGFLENLAAFGKKINNLPNIIAKKFNNNEINNEECYYTIIFYANQLGKNIKSLFESNKRYLENDECDLGLRLELK